MLGDLQHSLDVAEPERVVRIDENPFQVRAFASLRRRETRVAVRATLEHLGNAGGQRQITSPSRSVTPHAGHGKRRAVALGGLATTMAGCSVYITHTHLLASQLLASQRELAALVRDKWGATMDSRRHPCSTMKQRISALAPRARPGAQIASSADGACGRRSRLAQNHGTERSEEHTSELQSPDHLVCRLLLE